jgi:hypothetical protein
MSQLDEQVRAAVHDRAASISGPRFTADEIIQKGRGYVRRRRAGTVAVLTVVVALVAALGPAAHQRWTGPRPAAPVPVGSAGLAVMVDHTMRTPDGRSIELDLPAGLVLLDATRAAGGWVLVSVDYEIWFAPDGQAARRVTTRRLADPFSQWLVSSDGTALFIIAEDRIWLYELPVVRELHWLNVADFTDDFYLRFVGFAGGDLLIQMLSSQPDIPPHLLAWNIWTGRETGSWYGFAAAAVARDGSVLRATPKVIPPASMDVPAQFITSCLSVVPVAQVFDDSLSDKCGAPVALPHWGTISPDAAWATVQLVGQSSIWIVRTADIRAGVWRPTPLRLPHATVASWNSDATFIATTPGSPRATYHQCATNGVCAELVMPADLPDAVPLTRGDGLFPLPR